MARLGDTDEEYFFHEESPSRDRQKVWHQSHHFGRKHARELRLVIGGQYFVDPMNVQKKKHRGRQCEVIEVDDGFMPSKAYVRFTDARGGRGVVHTGDLLSTAEAERIARGASPTQ